MKPIAVLILACLPLASASADTVILSFPELAGGYEADPYSPPNPGYPQMRSLDFTIPAHVTGIDQLELVVSGDWIEGEITCNDGSGPEVSPFYAGLSLVLTSSAFPGDWYHASVTPPDGAFTELRSTVTSCCPPGVLDYNQLLGAEIHAEFYVDWALIGICWVSDDSYGTVSDVRLEILGTVPVNTSTWTEVKALYR